MIRAFIIFVCLALPAGAETPVPVSVANLLKYCTYDAQGPRDATRLAQLDGSLARAKSYNWFSVVETAPGVHRLTSSNQQTVIEFKLPDAEGNAHCMIFGPLLATGQGALAADKFVEFGMMGGLVSAPPASGTSRRYVVSGAPYTAELIAYTHASVGEVVGFMFSGVPQGRTTRELSSNDPAVTYRSVSSALSRTVEICLRNYFSQETVDRAISAYGFEFGFKTGRAPVENVYFTPDNAVSLRVKPGTCEIETRYMSPSATANVVRSALETTAPGQFDQRVESNSGCTSFFARPSLNSPMYININSINTQRGPANCVENGTSRIAFGVAG